MFETQTTRRLVILFFSLCAVLMLTGTQAVFGQTTSTTTIHVPASAVQNGSVRAVNPVPADAGAGVDVGPSGATAPVGSQTQPAPHFATLNTPVLLTQPEGSSLQIASDVIFYGLVSVLNGLVNTGINPLTIYDNLYVAGGGSSSTEYAGNVIVNGGVNAGSDSTMQHQLAGNLTVNGNVTLGGQLSTLSASSITIGSAATPANLRINNSLKADQVGSFYLATGSLGRLWRPTSTTCPSTGNSYCWPTTPLSSASCNAGDILISCSMDPGSRAATGDATQIKWFPTITNNSTTCNVYARYNSTTTTNTTALFDTYAQASCFSPNG